MEAAMSGPKQHHIPQMLQRGFQIRREPNWTWRYVRGRAPERSRIADTGFEYHFYSDPAAVDEERTLDGRITKFESTRLGELLHRVKRLEAGSSVDAADAAAIVAHLATRAGHIREVFADGLKGVVEGAADTLADGGVFRRALGFDAGEPTQRFRDTIRDGLLSRPDVLASGIPPDVVERMAFALASENFGQLFAEQKPRMQSALQLFAAQSERLARDAHNRALEKNLEGGARRELLASLSWQLRSAPTTGAIMP